MLRPHADSLRAATEQEADVLRYALCPSSDGGPDLLQCSAELVESFLLLSAITDSAAQDLESNAQKEGSKSDLSFRNLEFYGFLCNLSGSSMRFLQRE